MGILSMSPTNMDNCIEACVKCERACEECTTACLQGPNVQARVKCLEIVHFQNNSVNFLQLFVKHVWLNVRSFKTHIVKSMLKSAVSVLKNIVKWLQYKVIRFSSSLSTVFFVLK